MGCFFFTMMRSSNTQLICLRSNRRKTTNQLTERKLSAMSLLSSPKKFILPTRGIIFGVLASLLVQGAMAMNSGGTENNGNDKHENDKVQTIPRQNSAPV